MCYSVASIFADLDIQMLTANSCHDKHVNGARGRASGTDSTNCPVNVSDTADVFFVARILARVPTPTHWALI
jgi:hypothetical protein